MEMGQGSLLRVQRLFLESLGCRRFKQTIALEAALQISEFRRRVQHELLLV
jgi:hypothetical protein